MSGIVAYQDAYRKVKGALQPTALMQPPKVTASDSVNFSKLASQYMQRLQSPLDTASQGIVKGTLQPGSVSAQQLATSVDEATFVVQQAKFTLDKIIGAVQELLRVPM